MNNDCELWKREEDFTQFIIFVRWESRSSKLRKHLRRVFESVSEIAIILKIANAMRFVNEKRGIRVKERKDLWWNWWELKKIRTRARCMKNALCWIPAIPSASHFSSSSIIPSAIIISSSNWTLSERSLAYTASWNQLTNNVVGVWSNVEFLGKMVWRVIIYYYNVIK